MKTGKFSSEGKTKLIFAFDMFIYGTIGVFRRMIPLPSAFLVVMRNLIGFLFLFAAGSLIGQKPDFKKIDRRRLPLIVCVGICIALQCIFLFEAYDRTTVSTAVLCYYMAPFIIIMLSPIVFKERITGRKLICVGAAVFGMVLVSGVLREGLSGASFGGVLFGLGAAVFYAVGTMLNKVASDVDNTSRTILQLLISGIAAIPYSLLTESIKGVNWDISLIIKVLIMGAVHTGFANLLFFYSIGKLKAQTGALFTLFDPIVSIILSALLLHERMGGIEIIGAILIIGAALAIELPSKQKE